jgi:DNA repair exonuclease SbcCD ATPase subunit
VKIYHPDSLARNRFLVNQGVSVLFNGFAGRKLFERIGKMKQKLTIILLSLLLCSLFGLVGCRDAEKENAIAEAAAVKTDLAKVKADLVSIMAERDGLKLDLSAVTEARDKFQAMVGEIKGAKEQLAGLAKERDTAIAKMKDAQSIVEKLKGQLAEQIQKITGIEGQNKKLQGIIDELKKNLSSEVEIPAIPKL